MIIPQTREHDMWCITLEYVTPFVHGGDSITVYIVWMRWFIFFIIPGITLNLATQRYITFKYVLFIYNTISIIYTIMTSYIASIFICIIMYVDYIRIHPYIQDHIQPSLQQSCYIAMRYV